MPAGRPRAFNLDEALDRAADGLLAQGYEGATLPELTLAMGINRPSLYAAFGNKESLFRKAIDRYVAGPACHLREALQQPTARSVVERYLRQGVDLLTDSHNPGGCLMVQALTCGDTADRVRQELVKRRAASEAALRERFEQAKSEGDLPADSAPADLARYVAILSNGMAVQAVGGASRDELLKVVKLVLRTFPCEDQP